ncbi:hypothetical protein [Ruminococcus flavefaciens]|uniref:hypothetical protein n=1 Tax=Ruminococcus flavefaciens TaxID=1265 RepID=UPI0026F2C15D|nr:hypothetical protein [Ruminococcus flavefaciens]
MNQKETTDQQYLSDILNFKMNFCSVMKTNIFPKYSKIACSYLNTIFGYITNLAELSNQFAKLQCNSMFISSIIISRSIFEECSILNRLIRESKYGEKSNFYKSLFIQDMYQDIVINNGWNNNAEDYWRRIHNLLLQHFPARIQSIQIQPFINDADLLKGYTIDEKRELKRIVEELNEETMYIKYTKSKLCSWLFEDVYSNTDLTKKDTKNEAKKDIRIIYNQLCHYSHLSLTAIDDFNILKGEDGIHKPCFDKKIINNDVILQWMKYSLDYILTIFIKYCNDLHASKQPK